MILTDPSELSQYLPNHVLQNLDNLQGFFAISESDFLAERIGRPLLAALQQHYDEMRPVLTVDNCPADDPSTPWHELILLCQPVVAFDAVSRSADIQAVSVNQGGINISETGGYDVAPDKYIANYKAQCVKEAHAAVNRLLIQLEEWQKAAATTATTDEPSPFEGDRGGLLLFETAQSAPTSADTAAYQRAEIVKLWQQSAYYYYVEGLLFSTAQQFGSYINIYDSREKFIHLLPDIRYCQEVHIEAEVGEDFLSDLIARARRDQLSAAEQKAYRMLQRTLSLYVEARAPMFSARAQQARDEATGHMALTLRYINDKLKKAATDPSGTVLGSDNAQQCPKHGTTTERGIKPSRGFYSSSLI